MPRLKPAPLDENATISHSQACFRHAVFIDLSQDSADVNHDLAATDPANLSREDRCWLGIYLVKHGLSDSLGHLIEAWLEGPDLERITIFALFFGLTVSATRAHAALYLLQRCETVSERAYLYRSLLHASAGEDWAAARALACYQKLSGTPPPGQSVAIAPPRTQTQRFDIVDRIAVVPGDGIGIFLH